MQTLVTGAGGFIGSAVVRALLADGQAVKVLVRKGSDLRNLDGLDVERAYGDIREAEAVRAALPGCHQLFHVAAHFAHWTPDVRLPYAINVGGTRTVLTEALRAGLEKVVYTSTNNTLGAHGREKPADETAEFNHQDTGDHYSMSKYLGELEAKKLVAEGLPLVIVNPTLVLGARDRKPTPSGQMILAVAKGELPGYVEGGTNVIDVEDVAQGHLLAAKKGRVGERYLLGNENLSVGAYFRLIAEVAGVKPPRFELPYPVALTACYLFELGAAVTRKQPASTASELKIGRKYEFYDCSKAVRELGLPQTPVRASIERALTWFRENGYFD